MTRNRFDRPADQAGLGRDAQSARRRIEALETLLERVVTIPGLNRPLGLDALLGLVPVVGDIAAAALGSYIIWEARNLGLPKWHLARMAGNIAIDTAVGAIPFVGDIFDFAFRSNSRNLRLIRKYLDHHHPATATIEGISRPAR